MSREDIEQAFTDAGWQIDSTFAGHLLVGHYNDHLSILAHSWMLGLDEERFLDILGH